MSVSTSTARNVNGAELPATGTWALDPGHTEVAFIGRHFGLTKVRGRFTGVTGTVQVGDAVTDSHVEVIIDMASVESGSIDRDDHLRSKDFFDVAAHPTATFRSLAVEHVGADGTIAGELTIKGVTRPVSLDVEFLGQAHDPWGNERAVFSASATI